MPAYSKTLRSTVPHQRERERGPKNAVFLCLLFCVWGPYLVGMISVPWYLGCSFVSFVVCDVDCGEKAVECC